MGVDRRSLTCLIYRMAWKDVRITEDAHRAAKIAAAVQDSRLDEWLSRVVLDAATDVLMKNPGAVVSMPNGREGAKA